MKNFLTKHSIKFTRHLAFSVFLVLYLVVFAFLFTQKGIYLDGGFYKKSANLTKITYTAASPNCDFEQITLQKFIDKSLITVDGQYEVSVFSSGSFHTVVSVDSNLETFSADWVRIASQEAEGIRGFGSKSRIAVPAIYILLFLSRKYNVQLYTLFNRGKAAGENYYRVFDIVFVVLCIAGLIYFIIPI